MATGVGVSSAITLKGSTEIVAEYLDFAVNSILFQRGVYPPEIFTTETKYGLSLRMTNDPQLKKYIADITSQLKAWMLSKSIEAVIVAIVEQRTLQVVERWQFNIECDKGITETTRANKSEKEIQNEIQAVFRQIFASVTILPMLSEPCVFEMLVYADKGATVPLLWNESDPRIIPQGECIPCRTFSTAIHTVSTLVQFKSQS